MLANGPRVAVDCAPGLDAHARRRRVRWAWRDPPGRREAWERPARHFRAAHVLSESVEIAPPRARLYPPKTSRHHKGMERRLQMLGSALGFIAIGLMGLWEIVLRLH